MRLRCAVVMAAEALAVMAVVVVPMLVTVVEMVAVATAVGGAAAHAPCNSATPPLRDTGRLVLGSST